MHLHNITSAKNFGQLSFITLALTWLTVNIVTSRVFLTFPDFHFFLFSTIQCALIAVYIGIKMIAAPHLYAIGLNSATRKGSWGYEGIIGEFLKHAYFCKSSDQPAYVIMVTNWVNLGMMSWYIGLTHMSFIDVFFHTFVGDVFTLLLSITNGAILGNYMYSLVRVIWTRIQRS